MPTSGKSEFRSRRETIAGYQRMMEEASLRLTQMEEHLSELVLQNRQSSARVDEAELRFVPADIENAGQAIFKLPQGEAWIALRLSVDCGAPATAMYAYLDVQTPNRLVEVGQTDANGRYADSFANHLYIPERTDLIVVVNTVNIVHASIQVQVRRRHIQPLSTEEEFVLAGGPDEEEEEEIREALIPPTKEVTERHLDQGPQPPPRPAPNFASEVVTGVDHFIQETLG